MPSSKADVMFDTLDKNGDGVRTRYAEPPAEMICLIRFVIHEISKFLCAAGR